MPSFKVYLSDWAGKNEITPAKTIESDSQYSAIIDYMSSIDSTHIATHIVVTGGLSRNLRVFTIREFNQSIERKRNSISIFNKSNNTTFNEKNINDEIKSGLIPIENKTIKITDESKDLKLGLNQFFICLFGNGLQFSKLIMIDGESYTIALDKYLLQFKDKWGSFLYQNNIWIKNAHGNNKWCRINNQFAVEFEKNVRYQRAIREKNNIQIKVCNSNYCSGGENIFTVVAHDAADAFLTYVISHKEEVYPVSLHYSNETTKEYKYFDSSDYVVFVRGINSTKDVDHQLFKQFECKNYSTIEYYFELKKVKAEQTVKNVSISTEPKFYISTSKNKNETSIIADIFEIFECKDKDGLKYSIWMLLSWPILIIVLKESVGLFGKKSLNEFFESLFIFLVITGFVTGALLFINFIDRDKFTMKVDSFMSFIDKYPILYAPACIIFHILISPWIAVFFSVIGLILMALLSGGGRYSE